MKQAKSLKKSMRRCLLAAILLSVALPAGILMIIFGATGQRYVLMTFGIVFTVAGFYGMPMVWVRYGSYFPLRAIAGAVEDGLYETHRIAQTLGRKEEEVKKNISDMIARRYLTGYSFDGKILSPLSPRTVERVGKCPNCGGNLTVTEKGATCPYCGAQYIER